MITTEIVTMIIIIRDDILIIEIIREGLVIGINKDIQKALISMARKVATATTRLRQVQFTMLLPSRPRAQQVTNYSQHQLNQASRHQHQEEKPSRPELQEETSSLLASRSSIPLSHRREQERTPFGRRQRRQRRRLRKEDNFSHRITAGPPFDE
ncbi:hypothetical protein LSTR_LSTR014255 [Laodelphax striatellus]|uniref:Uncharacterized protein n=1 Tax=Laodelphax striatellus TaxID=195883 RepID=A0A482X5N3_LAOST|nr:hypothetical protein LSTR_LSTR014255 [Laodelphax striatellus]